MLITAADIQAALASLLLLWNSMLGPSAPEPPLLEVCFDSDIIQAPDKTFILCAIDGPISVQDLRRVFQNTRDPSQVIDLTKVRAFDRSPETVPAGGCHSILRYTSSYTGDVVASFTPLSGISIVAAPDGAFVVAVSRGGAFPDGQGGCNRIPAPPIDRWLLKDRFRPIDPVR